MPHLYGRVKVTVTGLAEDWEASLADLKTIHLDKVCEPYVEKFGVRGYSTSRVEAAKHPLAKRVL